ncbi:Poly(A) RNA polymerase GLD2 [Vanrija pseudolonga]|uniref:Poly(A) RNA polymerase GLD2 n=1 Tax=Vanrija pseudolonga TaxID=143232 RepID=A0AAF1BHE0_9TREE|nr:Poly(A) RNA polymerase GLD2 [Vanrija pseudolonga]
MAGTAIRQHAAAHSFHLIDLDQLDDSQPLTPKDTSYTSHEAYTSHEPRPSTTFPHTLPPSCTDNSADLIHLGSSDTTLRDLAYSPSSPPDYPVHDFLLSGYGYDPLRPSDSSPIHNPRTPSPFPSSDIGREVLTFDYPLSPPPPLIMATQTITSTWEQGGARPNPLNAADAPFERYRALPSPRLSTPAAVVRSEQTDKLQQAIMASWRGSEPGPERTAAIVALLARLTALVNRHSYVDNPRGNRYRVDVFGSVSWGGETKKSSDLDLVIVDTRLLQGYIPSLWKVPVGGQSLGSSRGSRTPQNDKVPLIYDMYWLANKLRNTPGYSEVTPITKANTPIVKFKTGGLECDINCNDMGGWYNSLLIQAYARVSPYVFRPMIHALKKWAAVHNLNDYTVRSKTPTTMSSYCLTLMAIAYLQKIEALPNLQKGVVVPPECDPTDLRQRDAIWISWGREQGQLAHIWFRQEAPAGWTTKHPHLTAAQAVFGFFRYYCGQRGERDVFDPRTQFVSVLNGGILIRPHPQNTLTRERQDFRQRMDPNTSREEVVRAMAEYDYEIDSQEKYMGTAAGKIAPRKWDEKRLVVQDPFIWDKNCAAGMSKEGLDRFFKTAVASYRLLEDADTSLTDLLALKV